MDKRVMVGIVLVILVALVWNYVGITGNVVEGIDLSKGMVADYLFDTGNELVDSSGNGYDVLEVKGALHGERYGDRGYRFDGANDYLDLGDAEGLALGDSFTLSAWVRPDSEGSRRVLFRGTGSATEKMNYQLLVGQGKARVAYGTGSSLRFVDGIFDYDGDGHFVAGTLSSSARELSLYVDGRLLNTSSVAGSPYLEDGARALIGTGDSLYGAGVQTHLAFDGLIDDVRMYERSLDADEVAALHGVDPVSVVDEVVEETEDLEELVEDSVVEEREVVSDSQGCSGGGSWSWFLAGVVVAVLVMFVWKKKSRSGFA